MHRSFPLTRRRLLGGLGFAVAAPAVLRAADLPAEPVEIATVEGRLRGARIDGVSIFKGVRYAAPLTPEDRFKAPRKLQSWTGVRDALAYGAPSIQPVIPNLNGVTPDEDCLFLNIWTPATGADGRRRAVMYYLHGGGFVTGSGSARGQDGANLARNNDVIVVETNHRLGLLGHLWLGDLLGADYATSGNQSLFDITEGLDWVRRNAEAFGGDPGNVMVWGESGGGAKTSCIYAFNPAAPLFHKASIESGPGLRMSTPEQAAASTRFVLDQLGISPGDARKLLDVPADKLLAIQNTRAPAAPARIGKPAITGIGAGALNTYSPVVDGRYLPQHPFDPAAPAISAKKPLMVGGNKDEATFFINTGTDKSAVGVDEAGLQTLVATRYGADNASALIAAYRRDLPGATPPQIAVAMQSDTFSRLGSARIADLKAAQGSAPVYMYRLTEGMQAKIGGTDYPLGASHALDISLKFDNSGDRPNEPDGGAALKLAAKNMSRYWANFAKTSIPAAQGQPAWPAYTVARRPMMLIKAQCEVVDDQYPAIRQAWAQAT